jgi:hypothetical protein
MKPDLQTYGFKYRHNGRNYAFDILAETREDAEARLASLAKAECVGELRPQENHTT